MKKLITTLFFCVSTLSIIAQADVRGGIRVLVKDQDAVLPDATVELLKQKDSALVKAMITDAEGKVVFENIGFDSYILKVTMVNFMTSYSEPFVLNSANILLHNISLQKSSGEMKAVVVSAKKPFIQKLTDRIVVNVDNSIVNAGSSAFDVLERSPGVLIDPNDNISLRGRAGVIIMIDGKITPMTGADLVNMLRSLPSNSIESIHIITNPSAKYDAAGNSGIIDIRMKKDQRMGTNGTLTAGYGQGVYPKTNAGITLNYRNKKVNLFGNYNYAYRVNLNHLVLDRNFFNNGTFSGADLKDNYAVMPFNAHATRFGADFFPSKKTIVGFVVNANFNKFDRVMNNNSIVINDQRKISSTFKTRATNDDNLNNIVANINVKHTFDSSGREIMADVDYGVYNSGSLTGTATKYFALDGTSLQPDYILDGDQDGELTLKTAKVDYSHPFGKKIKLETGLKSSLVKSDNDAKFWDVSNGTPQNDVNKTNQFFYEEENHAGYVNLSSEFKKINIQVGLRGEQTNVKTHQVKGNTRWDSSYFQLFPSAFFTYKLKEDKTIGISVSRRIDRPGYSQLNPFLFLIDVTTYATGNPGLLPQVSWSYELSYTLKSLSFTLGYSHTTNNQNIAIVKFKEVFPNIPTEDNVTVQIPVNLTSSDYVGLTIAAPVRMNAWWNMINNADIFYNKYNGNLAGTALNQGTAATRISTNNTFNLAKGWTAEFNASFSSGGRSGYMVFEPQWGIGAGVQKSVLNNRGTLRFSITDIFWTNLPKALNTYNNYIEKWHAQRETRVATFSFSYRFGKNTVAAARRRTTASEEERSRAGN